MTSAILALVASVGYGSSDYCAGVLAKRLPTVLIAFWSQVLGLFALGAAAAISGQPFALDGFVWGLAAGVVGALAVLIFYRGLELGKASIVAPVSAAGVLIPVGVAAARGDAPGLVGLLGIPVAVIGLALVASQNATDDRPETQPCVGRRVTFLPPVVQLRRGAGGANRAILLALASAIGFGVFFVLLDQATSTAKSSELWVVFGVLVSSLPTTLVAVVRQTASLRLSVVLAPIALVAVLDLVGDASLTFATSDGDLATVGVLASLDPVVTVLLAIGLLRERLPARQALGVVACLAGVVLVASG